MRFPPGWVTLELEYRLKESMWLVDLLFIRNRLRESLQRTLRRFDWALLCDVTGESAEVVLDALRAGVDAQLLVADPTRLGAVQFRHALTRDAVLERLLPAQWSELARRSLRKLFICAGL